jgi:LysM repeat protein
MPVVSRRLAHVVVLVIAMALSGYASFQKHVTTTALRMGLTNAQARVMSEGGIVGDIEVGRLNTVIKPQVPPTSPEQAHSPITYVVAGQDDLKRVAVRFGLTVEEVRWSNAALQGTDKVKTGQKLLIPPVHGIVAAVHKGDTASSIAAAYQADAGAISAYNYLSEGELLTEGSLLVVPGGRGQPFPAADSPPSVEQAIHDAFAPLGPGAVAWAMRVAGCESHYNPYAVNRSSGASGVFQFLPSTWASSPYAGASVFDPGANAQAAAWLYQHAGPGQWECR